MHPTIQKGSTSFPSLRPFLRWAGGKQKLVNRLLSFVPPLDRFRTYYEPFLGGGSLFFALQPPVAALSDVNIELMNCYRRVAQHPYRVAELINKYARKDSRKFYLRIRDKEIVHISADERAARFIYLNKAAFNGIYRVNTLGRFNVPYGPSSGGPAIPSIDKLAQAARCLRPAKLSVSDFQEAVANAKKEDFVYLDPPYPPRSETSYFTHYSAARFNWEDQERVARVFSDLSARGCLVLLSNADQKRIVKLYSQFRLVRLKAIRWLGSNGDRFRASEIIVTNYSIKDFSS